MAEKDTVTKTLEEYDDVFADIVNVLLFGGKRVVKEDELSPADIFSQYKASGNISMQERDVSKFWKHTGVNIAFVGIENQSSPDKTMPMRVISYDGAAYRSQLKVKNDGESHYYPVVTIVLYFGEDDWSCGRSLFDCIEIEPGLKPFVNDYRINLFSMKDMTEESVSLFESDFGIIAEFFMKMNSDGNDITFSDRPFDHPQETLDLISVFSGDSRFTDEYNRIESEKREGGISMCDIYDKIEERGLEKGMEEGIQKGMQKGMEKGMEEGIQKGMQKGMEKGMQKGMEKGRSEMLKKLTSLGNSVRQLSEMFGMSENEIERLLAL